MELKYIPLDDQHRELTVRGTPMFPCAAYYADISRYPGGIIPWHWHEELELLTVLRGQLLVRLSKKSVVIKPGDGIFINRNVLHAYFRATEENCEYLALVFHDRIIGGAAGSVFENSYVQPVLSCRMLDVLLLRRDVAWQREALQKTLAAHALCEEAAFGYELAVREQLSGFWRLLVTNLKAEYFENRTEDGLEQERIKKMLSFVQAHYTEALTTARIAEAAHISERECFRCFQRVIGLPPVAYLMRHRIAEAARMLLQKDQTVTEICFAVGFNHPSYFGRVFRAQMGCSPREYRKTNSQ